MIGSVELERPYCYGRHCHCGHSPLDDVLGLHASCLQRDGQQAAVDLAVAWPFDTAARQFERLSGMRVSRERLHTFTNRVAEGRSVLDVVPSGEERARRVAQVAQGHLRRPVLVLGVDGAYVPSRPARARGRRPGKARQRARRARWQHAWRAAQGLRFSLLDGDRMVHVLSWHQIPKDHDLGAALRQGKEAGWMPTEAVRLGVVCDGAEWLWKHLEALVPQACPVLDYDHGSAYLHKVAKAPYVDPVRAQAWAEATLTRL